MALAHHPVSASGPPTLPVWWSRSIIQHPTLARDYPAPNTQQTQLNNMPTAVHMGKKRMLAVLSTASPPTLSTARMTPLTPIG